MPPIRYRRRDKNSRKGFQTNAGEFLTRFVLASARPASWQRSRNRKPRAKCPLFFLPSDCLASRIDPGSLLSFAEPFCRQRRESLEKNGEVVRFMAGRGNISFDVDVEADAVARAEPKGSYRKLAGGRLTESSAFWPVPPAAQKSFPEM